MPKRLNPNLAKIHYPYSVTEAAQIWGIHPHTIRAWIKAGLPTIDNAKPTLIHGAELGEYVREQNRKRKYPCEPYEIFCVKCKRPKTPAMSMVDFVPQMKGGGCITGLCPSCDGVINKFVKDKQLDQIRQNLDVSIRPIENT